MHLTQVTEMQGEGSAMCGSHWKAGEAGEAGGSRYANLDITARCYGVHAIQCVCELGCPLPQKQLRQLTSVLHMQQYAGMECPTVLAM